MTMEKIRSVAFIPARSGSKRIPNKNIKLLGGHPLLAYSISAALNSGIFDSVICATDSKNYASVARHYGAEVPFLRPASISGDDSPDIEWVSWMLKQLSDQGNVFNVFSILRPTSPFRSSLTIQKAWAKFISDFGADSLRAVEKCKEHPGKMWVLREERMLPLLPLLNNGTPWHSSQYAALPEIYTQNASLEIAWSRVALEGNSIAGSSVIPFFSDGLEGFDLNSNEDWWLAEKYVSQNAGILPLINCPFFNDVENN